EHAVEGVDEVVEGRELAREAGDGVLPLRYEVGADAEAGEPLDGAAADGGEVDAREGAGVEAVLLEAVEDGVDGVAGGEDQPQVAAVDEPAEALLHGLLGARRLHREGGQHLG